MSNGSNMTHHSYTVEFRIWSDALDPESVTRELGLEPCQVRTRDGDRLPGRQDRGLWAYRPSGSPLEWESLEEALRDVLTNLWPHRHAIANYAANAQLVWWCRHTQSSFDGGPTLSADLLQKLGEFGAALLIDNYFTTVEDE